MTAGSGERRVDALMCSKQEHIVSGSEQTESGNNSETCLLKGLGRDIVADCNILEAQIRCCKQSDISEFPVGSVC